MIMPHIMSPTLLKGYTPSIQVTTSIIDSVSNWESTVYYTSTSIFFSARDLKILIRTEDLNSIC